MSLIPPDMVLHEFSAVPLPSPQKVLDAGVSSVPLPSQTHGHSIDEWNLDPTESVNPVDNLNVVNQQYEELAAAESEQSEQDAPESEVDESKKTKKS